MRTFDDAYSELHTLMGVDPVSVVQGKHNVVLFELVYQRNLSARTVDEAKAQLPRELVQQMLVEYGMMLNEFRTQKKTLLVALRAELRSLAHTTQPLPVADNWVSYSKRADQWSAHDEGTRRYARAMAEYDAHVIDCTGGVSRACDERGVYHVTVNAAGPRDAELIRARAAVEKDEAVEFFSSRGCDFAYVESCL